MSLNPYIERQPGDPYVSPAAIRATDAAIAAQQAVRRLVTPAECVGRIVGLQAVADYHGYNRLAALVDHDLRRATSELRLQDAALAVQAEWRSMLAEAAR